MAVWMRLYGGNCHRKRYPSAKLCTSRQTEVKASVPSSSAGGSLCPAGADSVQNYTSHYRLALFVGGTLWVGPGSMSPVPALLLDRKRLNRGQLAVISGQLASFFVYVRVYTVSSLGKGNNESAFWNSLVVRWADWLYVRQPQTL